MSEQDNTQVEEQAPAAQEQQPELSRRDALRGSLEAVTETKRLIQTGHFAGVRARKIVMCLGYLDALEQQIRAQIKLEKK